MIRRLPLIIVSAVLLALAMGQASAPVKKVLVLNDGRRLAGIITKTETGYEIKMEFATLEFRASQVAGVEDVVSPDQEYKDRLAKIDPKNAEAHFEIAQWAITRNYLDFAKAELEQALALKPDTDKYKWQLAEVDAKLKKLPVSRPDKTSASATAAGTPAAVGVGVPPSMKPEWLLGDDDICRVRLEELRENDTVAVEFRNKVLDRFIMEMSGTREFKAPGAADAFLALRPVDRARYMIHQLDPDSALKCDIQVKGDPRFMVDFRTKVWPLVARGCATNTCHGGGNGKGGMRLFTSGGTNYKVEYTNFAILDGMFRGNQRMINRANADNSLLLDFGLPVEQTKLRHPVDLPVVYETRQSPNYQAVLAWIGSLANPHPDYRLTWTPPFDMKLKFGGGTSWLDGKTPASEPAPK